MYNMDVCASRDSQGRWYALVEPLDLDDAEGMRDFEEQTGIHARCYVPYGADYHALAEDFAYADFCGDATGILTGTKPIPGMPLEKLECLACIPVVMDDSGNVFNFDATDVGFPWLRYPEVTTDEVDFCWCYEMISTLLFREEERAQQGNFC